MFVFRTISLLFVALASLGCAAPKNQIIQLDELDDARIRQCIGYPDDNPKSDENYQCLIGVSPRWEIDLLSFKLAKRSEPVNPNGPPPASVLQLLQEIVERCELGSAYLQNATDGGARLLIGNPDLKSSQLNCVRSAERPGLRVAKREY